MSVPTPSFPSFLPFRPLHNTSGCTAAAPLRPNNEVGNVFLKGISGGQKRRTSIGAELVVQRKIVFLGTVRWVHLHDTILGDG